METFIRKELKYQISDTQKHALLQSIAGFIEPDLYPDCDIYSVYLDTDQLDLLRLCEAKPEFRQKVRLRSYAPLQSGQDRLFLELKKKADGVCFKARSEFTLDSLHHFLEDPQPVDQNTAELCQVFRRWKLRPQFALYAHRRCWVWKGRRDLRLTIDDQLTWRRHPLFLGRACRQEEALLEPGQNILEIKCAQNLPRPLVGALFELSISPASFSKAGRVYQRLLERKQTT